MRLFPKDDEPEHHADDGVSEGTALCRSFASYGAASAYVQLYVLKTYRRLVYRPLAERISVGYHVSNGTRFPFRWMCVTSMVEHGCGARCSPQCNLCSEQGRGYPLAQ